MIFTQFGSFITDILILTHAEILLEETYFKGFPVVDDMEYMRLYGYVRRKELKTALGEVTIDYLDGISDRPVCVPVV